jgi:hypothetical protein
LGDTDGFFGFLVALADGVAAVSGQVFFFCFVGIAKTDEEAEGGVGKGVDKLSGQFYAFGGLVVFENEDQVLIAPGDEGEEALFAEPVGNFVDEGLDGRVCFEETVNEDDLMGPVEVEV